MPRSRTIIKRIVEPDPVYNSKLVTKLINKSMWDGKKSTAATQIYRAFEIVKEKNAETDPAKFLEQVISIIGPKVEVRSRRVGGASYQVPTEVKGDRKIHLAIKWLLDAARARSNKEYHTFAQKLAAEMQDAVNNLGSAVKKRDTVAKMAEANRVFAHLRW